MANPTMTLIGSNTVGSGGASSITFLSIPATYTDLVVKVSARSNESSDRTNLFLRFNNVATSTYSQIQLYGNGSSTVSASASAQAQIYLGVINGSTSTANTFGNLDIYIPNYSGGNNKSISFDGVNENNATNSYAFLTAGVSSNSTPITEVDILPAGGTNFVQYSTFYLYGISNS
jgi:hypothetical protein